MRMGKRPFAKFIAMLLAAAMVLFNLPAAVFAQSEDKPKIAVWDFALEGMQPGDGRAVTNRLRSELVNSGKYQVMSRDQIETLLGEQALGQTLVDAKEAIKAGKLKGVQFVVTGTIITVRGAFQITAEMIDGGTAEIVKSITPATYRGGFLDFLDNEVPRLATQLAGEQPGPAVVLAPPPQALQETQPEPEPEQEGAVEEATWPLTAGIVSLVVAGVFQIIALAAASSAEDDADAATTNEEYQTALDDRDAAEGLQGAAALAGILGAVFLIIDATGFADKTAANSPGPGAAPVGFGVDVQPHSVMAGYTLRW